MVQESVVFKVVTARIIIVTIITVLALPHSQSNVGEGQSVKVAKQLV